MHVHRLHKYILYTDYTNTLHFYGADIVYLHTYITYTDNTDYTNAVHTLYTAVDILYTLSNSMQKLYIDYTHTIRIL